MFSLPPLMPIRAKRGEHYQASCDGCQGRYPAMAEVCRKRLIGAEARTAAMDKLSRTGWHVGGASTERECWYCPTCARYAHL